MRLVTRSFLFLLLACFIVPVYAFAEDRLDRIEKDLNEVKKENAELKTRIEEMQAEDEETKHNLAAISRLVNVSGYADAEYKFTNQQDENNGFRLRHLSLFFTKDIQKEWKLFTELEFEDAPRIESNPNNDTVSKSQGIIFLEQMYIQYHPSLDWDIRVGRFLTPAGIWWIYHYPPYVPTQTFPLMYKVIFPEVLDGIQLRNSIPLKDSIIDTNVYIANGSGNSGHMDRNENKSVGGRVNTNIINGLSAGFSYFREKNNQNTMLNSYGFHMLFNYAPFKVQAEYAIRRNRPESGLKFYDSGWYAQATYDINNWTIAGRYDHYDSNDTIPNNCQFRYTGAVNYHFAHNVVGKVEFNHNRFEDRSIENFNEVIMAIAVAIGDL